MSRFPGIFILVFLLAGIGYAGTTEFKVTRKDVSSKCVSLISDEKIIQTVIKTLEIDMADGLYSDVGIIAHDDHYVVYLFEANSYSALCYRLQKQQNGGLSVIKDYIDIPEDEKPCHTCPDESIRIVVSGSGSDPNHVSSRNIKKAYDDLTAAGFKVKHLAGKAENRQAILDWLSCKDLVLWGRIGHGTTGTIVFSGAYDQGPLTASDLSKLDLTNKLLIINSCYVHNKKFIDPVINTAKGKFFCGGDNVTLLVNQSEPVWYSIVTGGVRDKKEFGDCVTEGNKKLSPSNKYGFTRHPSTNGKCFYQETPTKIAAARDPGVLHHVRYQNNTILISVPGERSNEKISIALYTLKGVFVMHAYNRTASPGTHAVAIENHTLSEGMYLCMVHGSGLAETIKLTVTK